MSIKNSNQDKKKKLLLQAQVEVLEAILLKVNQKILMSMVYFLKII